MRPIDLQAGQFSGYPGEAQALAVAHLPLLRQLPLSFLPSLLRELAEYDFKFPAERAQIDRELRILASLAPTDFRAWFRPFERVTISAALEEFDWVDQPAQFLERESAYLWTTHQLDNFRKAATEYGDRLRSAPPPESLGEAIPVRRLGIAIVGQGLAAWPAPLFRNLRAHGTFFGQIKPDRGVELALEAAAARAKAHPAPYAHWYVDGGEATDHAPQLTSVSYRGLEPARAALLKRIDSEIAQSGMGPEQLRTRMARLVPSDLGLADQADPLLDRFKVKLLTEGSGTQIFSTTFAQWTAREILRRAQAWTLIVRFAPRQRQRPMNEMLTGGKADAELDLPGSLIDAQMGAYYQWLNQQRLPGSERSAFVAWFEGHSQALAIAPTLPGGAESNTAMDLGQLLSLVSS